MKRLIRILPLFLLLAACAGVEIKPEPGLEEQFRAAKELFQKEKYADAAEAFEVLALSYSGSELMDSLKFFAAESHFQLKEYLLAASQYEYIVQNLPNSRLQDRAQFQLGRCYFELAPKYPLDQSYTYQAMDALNYFLAEFPQSRYRGAVEDLLQQCRAKLARKEFRNGLLYYKLKHYNSAIIYMDDVLENYYDVPEVAAEALYYKAECLLMLHRSRDAWALFREYAEKYPQGPRGAQVAARLAELQ